jgi:hypothetical protein
MSMFTSFEVAVAENKLKPSDLYTIERNKQAFEWYLKGKDWRACITEQLTAQRIRDRLGLDQDQVKVTTGKGAGGGAGHCPHDVEYQVMSDRYTRGTKTVRVEVKASISAKGDWTKHRKLMFSYQGIKPNNFDYIFLYEVNPSVGVIAKWTTRKHVLDFISMRKLKRYANGYTLTFSSLRNAGRIELYDLEDFPEEN